MKAEINDLGVLVITPDTKTEGFALKCWEQSARVERKCMDDNDEHHYRGRKIGIRYDVSYVPTPNGVMTFHNE